MKLFFALCFGTVLAFAQSEPYIKLGEAKTKKSLIAFPPLVFQGSTSANPNFNSLGSDLFTIITNDLTVSGLFQFIPQSAFLENSAKTGLKPLSGDLNGFNFSSWSSIGAEFLIKGAFSIAGSELTLEIYVYNVSKAQLVMGKKYKGPNSAVRRVAHTFSNDLMKSLTGNIGMFLSKIVVASDRAGGRFQEIFIMDWDGANLNKVTDHKTLSMSPAWSPDGKRIAYTSTVKRGRSNIRNHDLFTFELASGLRTLVSFKEGINSGAAFAPDSKSIFLTISEGSKPDIYRIDLSGRVLNRVTKGPLGAMNVEPAVSPDGNRVAYSSDRSGRPMIFVANSDGSNPVRITKAGVFNSSPSWSPDGKKIAFAGQEADHFDIFVMDADGTNMVRLTKAKKPNGRPANNEEPCFSPDGRFVMYTSDRSGASQIYFSTVDGSEERRITSDRFNYFKAKWSGNMD